MDDNLISSLIIVVNDKINENISRIDIKRKIDTILHGKSNKKIVNELVKYAGKLSGKKKNIATVIVIIALLIRNIDCDKEILALIQKQKKCKEIYGCLYGGLITLLSGNYEAFSVKLEWQDNRFINKLEFLNEFFDFKYWRFVEILQAVKILAFFDVEKFEKLALEDKTKIILLNMVSYTLDIKPTLNLINRLLSSDDELHKNIGFHFLTDNILNMYSTHLANESEIPITKDLKAKRKVLSGEIDVCLKCLEAYSEKTQADLLFNYILLHQNCYPRRFALKLMSSELQNEFVEQIRCSQKIRTLKELSGIVNIISETSALNKFSRRISKLQPYSAITDAFIQLVEDRKIYSLDKTNLFYTKNICNHLPTRCSKRLKTYLKKERKMLMCEEIDKLLRYKMFLKDAHQAEIINGILNILTPNNQSE